MYTADWQTGSSLELTDSFNQTLIVAVHFYVHPLQLAVYLRSEVILPMCVKSRHIWCSFLRAAYEIIQHPFSIV